MGKVRTFPLGVLLLTPLLAAIWFLEQKPYPAPLPPPWENGRLLVSTRPNLLGNPEPDSIWPGVEYQLLRRFAEQQKWQLQFTTPEHFRGIFDDVEQEQAHLAAANLSMTVARLERFLFTRPIGHSTVVVLAHARQPDLPGWQAMEGDVDVLAGSIFEDLLRNHGVHYNRRLHGTVLDLLDALEDGQIRHTLLDRNVWLLFRPFFPNVRVVLETEERLPIGWALPVTANGLALKRRLDAWLTVQEDQGHLARMWREDLLPAEDYDPAGTFYFRRLSRERLPRYRHLFEATAALTGLDWQLLAAMAYQESHWNPLARSSTGVRGLMMLTRKTARELGVANRLDSEESVLGAARYLIKLRDKLPERIADDHRLWFALAAYNIGFRHLENARRLAQTRGADPDNWFEVRPWLARLNERELVRSIGAWPADGRQAARYVSHIQLYYRFLVWDSARRQP